MRPGESSLSSESLKDINLWGLLEAISLYFIVEQLKKTNKTKKYGIVLLTLIEEQLFIFFERFIKIVHRVDYKISILNIAIIKAR